jgi:lipopolysaccharide transport system permease protein
MADEDIEAGACTARRPHTRVHRIAPPAPRDLWDVLSTLPDYAGLLRVFVLRQVSVRYRQSLLGVLWVVAQPLATTLIVFFMFRIIGAETSRNLPVGLFLFVGVMIWQFFSRGVQDGTMSLRINRHILTKIYFPRVILVSGVLTAWFEILVTMSMLLGVCILQNIELSPRIALLPVFIVLISFASLAVSLWLAPIDVLARDITFILPFALQFGMYASPVLYGAELVPDRWKPVFYLNPMSTLIEGVRWSIFRHEPSPDPAWLALNIITVMILLFGGLWIFHKFESTVVDRI